MSCSFMSVASDLASDAPDEEALVFFFDSVVDSLGSSITSMLAWSMLSLSRQLISLGAVEDCSFSLSFFFYTTLFT